MIAKQKNGWTWYQDGCHPVDVGCLAEGRERCTCRYHISDGTVQYGFDDYAIASEKWSALTGEQEFRLGKDIWS